MPRLLALVLACVAPLHAGERLTRTSQERFQDARFGLFLHWGIYSVLGEGEWALHRKQMALTAYAPLADHFNPVRFDAEAWVRTAQEAGMRYITFTAKHHDGFALWHTRQSRWNVVDGTPLGRDVVRELSQACAKAKMPLFLYYSQLDWHHPDYHPRGWTGQYSGRPDTGNFDRYLDYVDAQLEELLTGYGPIAGIWFDGWWDRPDADWRLDRTYGLIHRLQPAALVGNNHHRAPKPGEDFQMFEQDLPGQNTAGHSPDAVVGALPLETCDTMNRSWGFNRSDTAFKSPRELIHRLVRAAGHNANLLLNVGPTPEGEFQPEVTERLRAVGTWLKTAGVSVYGTRGGPISPRAWGVSTQTAEHVYLHVLEWQDRWLAVPGLQGLSRPRLLQDGKPVRTVEVDGATVIELPAEVRDPIDTIVVFDRVAPVTR